MPLDELRAALAASGDGPGQPGLADWMETKFRADLRTMGLLADAIGRQEPGLEVPDGRDRSEYLAELRAQIETFQIEWQKARIADDFARLAVLAAYARIEKNSLLRETGWDPDAPAPPDGFVPPFPPRGSGTTARRGKGISLGTVALIAAIAYAVSESE